MAGREQGGDEFCACLLVGRAELETSEAELCTEGGGGSWVIYIAKGGAVGIRSIPGRSLNREAWLWSLQEAGRGLEP